MLVDQLLKSGRLLFSYGYDYRPGRAGELPSKEIDYQTDCWKERTQRRGKLEEVTCITFNIMHPCSYTYIGPKNKRIGSHTKMERNSMKIIYIYIYIYI
jgi:hypothetical protein